MGILDKLRGKAPKKSDKLLNESPAAEAQFDVEVLSPDIKKALAELAMAGSAEEFGERARNIHALAKVQADALVDKINALPDDSPLVGPGAPALAELVLAMSQAEAYAFKSDPFKFAGAPANVQASWLDTVKAAVHDEAGALAKALAAYRRLHGLDP